MSQYSVLEMFQFKLYTVKAKAKKKYLLMTFLRSSSDGSEQCISTSAIKMRNFRVYTARQGKKFLLAF